MTQQSPFIIHHSSLYSRGFTLIEFMLAVAILLILAGTAPVFYSRFLLQDAALEAADRLAFSLRNAQGYALSGKGGAPWGVAISGGDIVLFRGASFAARTPALDRRVSLPANVSVGGFSETVFARVSGIPNAPATITITASGGVSRSLVLNAAGVVSRL